ncbi:hypothetical protein AB1M95_10375 [Sulfitobacter sp. LCG007]
MEMPDLQQAPNGKELFFKVKGQGKIHIVTIPRELFDDELSNEASISERKAWVELHIEEIMAAYRAKTEIGSVRVPFNKIQVRTE